MMMRVAFVLLAVLLTVRGQHEEKVKSPENAPMTDLSDTSWTTKYCSTYGKRCPSDLAQPNPKTSNPSIEADEHQCRSRCNRNKQCASIFYEKSQKIRKCHQLTKRCLTSELVDSAADDLTLYRLEKGEQCPSGQIFHNPIYRKYVQAFCVWDEKKCVIQNKIGYGKDLNIKTNEECMVKCSKIISCTGVNFSKGKCDVHGGETDTQSCSDQDLANQENTPTVTYSRRQQRGDSCKGKVVTEKQAAAPPAQPKKEQAKPAQQKKEQAKPAEPKKEQAKPAEPKKEQAKPAEPKKEQAKPAEPKKEQAKPKKEQAKPAEPKKEQVKPAEPKKEHAKPAEPKKEQAKPAEPKKEQAKPAEPKKEQAKPAQPKKEQAKPAEPKKEQAKPAEPKHGVRTFSLSVAPAADADHPVLDVPKALIPNVPVVPIPIVPEAPIPQVPEVPIIVLPEVPIPVVPEALKPVVPKVRTPVLLKKEAPKHSEAKKEAPKHSEAKKEAPKHSEPKENFQKTKYQPPVNNCGQKHYYYKQQGTSSCRRHEVIRRMNACFSTCQEACNSRCECKSFGHVNNECELHREPCSNFIRVEGLYNGVAVGTGIVVAAGVSATVDIGPVDNGFCGYSGAWDVLEGSALSILKWDGKTCHFDVHNVPGIKSAMGRCTVTQEGDLAINMGGGFISMATKQFLASRTEAKTDVRVNDLLAGLVERIPLTKRFLNAASSIEAAAGSSVKVLGKNGYIIEVDAGAAVGVSASVKICKNIVIILDVCLEAELSTDVRLK